MNNDIIYLNNKSFITKVAITEDEHELGLMFTKNPYVMSFPYKTSAVRKFWMKNVNYPLDIVFCKSGKIVSICKGFAHSENFVGPNFATDLVVELPYGTVSQYKLFEGDTVRLELSRVTYLKKFAYELAK